MAVLSGTIPQARPGRCPFANTHRGNTRNFVHSGARFVSADYTRAHRTRTCARRMSDEMEGFPGEDAPRTGKRQVPPPEGPRLNFTPYEFPQLTTEACYQAFPRQVKSSCPVTIDRSSATSGRDLSLVANAGPTTGQRVRPPVNTFEHNTESSNEIEGNMRAVQSRRGG